MKTESSATNPENGPRQYSVREKLKLSLFKLLDMNYDVTDDSILSKLVSFLAENSKEDLGSNLYDTYEEWLIACIVHWKNGTLKPTIAVFSVQILSILCRNATHFSILNGEKLILKQFQDLIENKLSVNPLFPIAYAKLLSSCISHDEGMKHALEHELWRKVMSVYMANESLYVKKECREFLVTVCASACEKNLDAPKIVAHIFELYDANRQNPIYTRKKYAQVLNLLTSIFETFLVKRDFKVADAYFSARPGFCESLWSDFSAPRNDETLMKISKLLILSRLICFASTGNIDGKLFFEESLVKILQRFLEKDSFREVALTCELTAKYCHSVLVDLNSLENLLAIRLAPVFVALEKLNPTSDANFDFLSRHLLLWPSVGNFVEQYALRLRQANLGSTAVSCLTALDQEFENPSSHYKTCILKVLVCIFQEYFVPKNPDEFSSDCIDSRLTLALLVQLKNVVAKQAEIPECQTYVLLTHLVTFLSIPGQPPTLSIAPTLNLIRQILETLPENPDASIINIIQSVLPDLQKMLLKYMYSISWEVRDSVIEVLSSVADVTKNIPSDGAINLQLAEDVFAVFVSDTEYYVRASAIVCLCKLVTIDDLWSRMDRENVLRKLLDALRTEDEAIVRRQIPLLLKEIYLQGNISEELLGDMYPALVRACTKDLHWEVCINALEFWRCVIVKHLRFPDSESARSVRPFFVKQLTQLNNMGCLRVIMKCLHNEADLEVCKKAAAVLQELSDNLNEYISPDLTQRVGLCQSLASQSCTSSDESARSFSVLNATNSESDELESTAREKPELSDKIIDSIVSSKDVNLLACVYKASTDSKPAVFSSTDSGGSVLIETELIDMFMKTDVVDLIRTKVEFFGQSQNNLESLLNDILLPGFNNSQNPTLDCY